MRVGSRAAAVAACVAVAACGAPGEERRALPAEPDLRLWAPPLVRWEAGTSRRVDFSIENPTRRTVSIAAPDPALARVDVLAGPESVRVCGVVPAERVAPGERIALAPGDRVAVLVDLGEACGDVPPGEYRYEISYRAAEPAGAGALSGTLGVRHGQVLVSAPSAEAGSLGAAPVAPAPPRQGRAEPPRAGRGRDAGPAAPPDGR